MDTLTRKERSRIMALVKGKGTKPEVIVRKLVSALGYRYRLHGRDLPGSPDLVFRKARRAIFVHGCFWHRHKGCPNCRLPKSRLDFWLPKLRGNRFRDLRNQKRLKKLKWRTHIVWECELKDTDALRKRLTRFLGGRN